MEQIKFNSENAVFPLGEEGSSVQSDLQSDCFGSLYSGAADCKSAGTNNGHGRSHVLRKD